MSGSTVTEEIQELRAMDVPKLVERYEALHGKPPRVKNRAWLWRRCAWKLQEQRFGGLSSTARRRLDELAAEIELPIVGARTTRASLPCQGKPREAIGTTLARRWRGRQVEATRTAEGWIHDGVVHRSLSAVAKAVTGTHTSGPAFFGLTTKKASR